MAAFPAEFSSQAFKYLKKLEELMKGRIKERIDKLEENPFPQEVERVEDFQGEKVFRVRVGNHRILYIVRYSPNKLIIVKVNTRPRVYD